MLWVLTCLISVNPRELSAYLRMECNFFMWFIELIYPPWSVPRPTGSGLYTKYYRYHDWVICWKTTTHSLNAVMGIWPVQTIDYRSMIVWPARLSPKPDTFCSAAFMAFSFCLIANTTRGYTSILPIRFALEEANCSWMRFCRHWFPCDKGILRSVTLRLCLNKKKLMMVSNTWG